MTEIKNCPETMRKYVVFREADGAFWYYGSFDEVLRASEVATEVGGFIEARNYVKPIPMRRATV